MIRYHDRQLTKETSCFSADGKLRKNEVDPIDPVDQLHVAQGKGPWDPPGRPVHHDGPRSTPGGGSSPESDSSSLLLGILGTYYLGR